MTRKKKASRREIKRYAGKSREEWRVWGEEFGKNVDNFSEEMQGLRRRFDKRMEKRDRCCEGGHRHWWFSTFGFIGPLIGGIVGIIFLLLGVWILNLINTPFGSGFVSAISSFFLYNISWFFIASVLFGYDYYFRKIYPRSYWIFSPIVGSVRAIFVIYVLISLLAIASEFTGVIFSNLTNFFYTNIFGLFIFFLFIGYVIEIIKNSFRCCD